MSRIIIMLTGVILFAGFYTISSDSPEGLAAGEKAPDFSGVDQFGKDFSLKGELSDHKVVLMFYRGSWCSYCNKHLSKLQDSISMIIEKGATVIVITPEKAEYIQETSEKYDGTFRIIHDENLSIMNAYKVTFALDHEAVSRYKKGGIDFKDHYGKNGTNLPVPATYIIDRDGRISFAHFDSNYKNRASMREIIINL